jgi:hypothetical protein
VKKIARSTVLCFLGACFLVALLVLLHNRSPWAENEQYAVYSAYLAAQISEGDPTRQIESGRPLLIQQRANNVRMISDRIDRLRTKIPDLETSTIGSFAVRNLTSELFSKSFDLPVRYEMLSDVDLNKPASFPHPRYVTLSRVGFNQNLTQALFYTEDMCGLCGGAGYVFMIKSLGRWKVKKFLSTWVS